MHFLKSADAEGQNARGNRVDRADMDRVDTPNLMRIERGAHFSHVRSDLLRAREEYLSGNSQLHALFPPEEKLHAKFVLQLRKRTAQWRSRYMNGIGGTRDAAFPAYGKKKFNLSQCQGDHPNTIWNLNGIESKPGASER